MVRKLSLAIAMALGVSPLGVHALGLGDIHLKSALNQYLNADIDLLSVENQELEDIRVRLASPDAFQKAGVERPYFLAGLKFKPVKRPDGKSVIRVTSRKPVREPFLDFLVEVNWPKGRLLREYTVLLDPPVTLDRAPAPVTRPETAMAPPPRPAVPETPTASGTAAVAPDRYGPTRPNDTLWGIAKKVRQPGITMEQAMMALFRANPRAFINRDINKLMVGKVLKVPSREQVAALTPAQARAAFKAEVEGAPVAATPRRAAPPAAAAAPEAELKIATARPEGKGEGGGGESAAPAAETDQLREDLIAAREARVAALEEGMALKSRIQELQSQLEEMQRLLNLKDDELARLQLATGGGVAAETPATPPQAAGGETVEPLPEAGTGETPAMPAETGHPGPEEAAAIPEEGAQAPTGMEPEAGEEIEIDLSGEDETAEGSEAIFVDEQAPAAAVPETPVAEKSVPSEPEAAVTPPPKATPKPAAGPQKPRKEPSLWEKVADDTTLLGIVGAAILVILALLWALFSRSRSARDEFKESILMESLEGEPDQGGDAAVAASEEPDATTPDTETSFLSDFSPSAIDSLQDETSEADPLSEADVYIAYGRYRQAEELIRQAIALQPQRLELKQKLLEILFATRDVDAYTALARELADQGLEKKDPKGWERVLSMGAKLAPTAALFAAAAGGEEGLSTQGKSVAAGQPQPASPAAPQGGEETMGSLEDLDLDLGGLEDLDDLGKLGEEGLLGGKELDLDLDLADSGSPSVSGAAAAEASTRTEPEAAPDGEELRLSLDDLEDTVQGELPEEIDQGDTLNISLDEIPSLGPETVSGDTFDTLPGLAGGGVERDDTSLADLEKELGLDERADDGLAEAGEPGQVETLELPENEELPLPEEVMVGDEVDTKLDLAQAYLEMGDAEGARDILDEVLAEGSEKQKQEARKMLEQL